MAGEKLKYNKTALKAGYAFGETTEIFHTRNRVRPAKLPPGTYRNITGNEATGGNGGGDIVDSVVYEGGALAGSIAFQGAFLADGVGALEDPVLPGGEPGEDLGLHRLRAGKAEVRFHAGHSVG